MQLGKGGVTIPKLLDLIYEFLLKGVFITYKFLQGGSSRGGPSGTRPSPHRGYSRSQPSPSSTEETAEETTETDSQAPNERQEYAIHPHPM